MAIATEVSKVVSKGLDVFNQAPKQVQKQIQEGNEQGVNYLKGKHVKQQEIDQLAGDQEFRDAEAEVPEITGGDEGFAMDLRRLNISSKEARLGIPGADPYSKEKLPTSFSDIVPPDLNREAYEEVGYTLPRKMITDEARDIEDHWDAGITAHVRRDTKDGALRVFEIQSDKQNQLTKNSSRELEANVQFDMWVDEVSPADIPFTADELNTAHTAWNAGNTTVTPEAREALDKVMSYFHSSVFEPKAEVAKLSPYGGLNWDKDVINRQFVDAANQGLDKVDFLIKPEGNYMVRSTKVQKNYEERVAKQIQTLAKKIKGPNGEKATVEWVDSKAEFDFDEFETSWGDVEEFDDLVLDWMDRSPKIKEFVNSKGVTNRIDLQDNFDLVGEDTLGDVWDAQNLYFTIRDTPELRKEVTGTADNLSKVFGDLTGADEVPASDIASIIESMFDKMPETTAVVREFTDLFKSLGDIYKKQYGLPYTRRLEYLLEQPGAEPLKVTPEVKSLLERIDSVANTHINRGLADYVDKYLRVNLPKVAGGTALAAFTVPAFAKESEDSKKSNLPTRVSQAVKDGVTPAEIFKSLQSSGYELPVIQKALGPAVKPKVDQMRADGVPDEEILKVMQGIGIIPMVPTTQPGLLIDKAIGMQGPEQNEAVTEATGAPDSTILDQPEPLVQQQSPIDTLEPLPEGYTVPTIEIDSSPEQMLVDMRTVTNRWQTVAKEIGGIASSTLKGEAEKAKAQANEVIKRELNKRGVNVVDFDEYGTPLVQDEQGAISPMDEGVSLEDFFVDGIPTPGAGLAKLVEGGEYEAAGALAGGFIGSALTRSSLPAQLAVGTLTSAAGASLGAGADLLSAAQDLKYEVSKQEIISKMQDSGVADLTMSALGTTVFGLAKGTVKGLSMAWDRVANGNIDGAYQALKDTTNLNDAQIADLVNTWNTKFSAAAPDGPRPTSGYGNTVPKLLEGDMTAADKEMAIQVAGQTEPILKASVKKAAELSKTGGSRLLQTIEQRSSDVKLAAERVSSDTVVSLINTDLKAYKQSTSELFEFAKTSGTDLANAASFRFDFAPISKAVKDIASEASKITNYASRKDFGVYLDQLERLGKPAVPKAAKGSVRPKRVLDASGANSPRQFKDLLEIRRVLNELSSDSRFKSHINFEKIKGAKTAVDNQISKAASQMDGGDTWLSTWKKANIEYSKMKQLEENVLYKALSKPDVSIEKAMRAIKNSAAADDPAVLMSVLAKLTPRARRSAEGALFKGLLDDSTKSISDEINIVDFIKLKTSLDRFGFVDSEVKDLKRVVKEMATIFKNDPTLARIAEQNTAGRFQGNIATTVLGKIKMQAASVVFKAWQTVGPGKGARKLALTMHLRDVLDNPLNAKSVESLKRALPNDPELESLLHRLAIEYGKTGEVEKYGLAKLYRVSRPGNANKASDTSLGRGVMYYTDKAKAQEIAKGTGAKVDEVEKVTRRIAQPHNIDKAVEYLYNRPATPADYKDVRVIDLLRQNYDGITKDDKVLMFKE